MNNSKVAIAVSRIVSIIQMIAGVFLLVIFGISTVVYLFYTGFAVGIKSSFIIICLVLDAVGIMLVIFSRKRSKLIADFRMYVSYISADSTGSITNIAASMGTSANVVLRKLELMIKRNYFVNAYINLQTNCIIIGSSNNVQGIVQSTIHNTTAMSQAAPQIQMIAVTCKCCGARKKIALGTVSECDYCGSPIST